MDRSFTICEGILDALIDDVSSIVQIQEYLNYLGYVLKKVDLKNELLILLQNNIIRITYPTNINTNDFIKSDNNNIHNFWFELSELGKSEWEKI